LGLRDKYEAHHRIKYTDDALRSAVDLSSRYINGRFLPDKAIDVMDEAGARLRLQAMTHPPDLKHLEQEIVELDREKEEAVNAQDFERAAQLRDQAQKVRRKKDQLLREWREETQMTSGVVDEDIIRETVSNMTGVPLTRLEKAEAERLLRMEDELHHTVVSQDDAIHAIAKALRRSRSGLKDPRRPMGSFIFLGPTGVGKTHLSKALAQFMFGDEEALIQIDMSEYMEKHTVSRLVGAPPGYVGFEEGGQLTERVRRRPYSVVLFDEIEKAHHDAFNMLLQIMEEGRLTDSFGRQVDFKNTIVIMTSNLGAEAIKNQGGLGFQRATEEATYDKMREELMTQVERHFRPEFLNRVDEIIVFHQLTRDDLREIIDIETRGLADRLRQKQVEIELSAEAKEHIIGEGYNPDYGARPLKRAIQRLLEDPLAEEVLRGHFPEGTLIEVKFADGQLTFEGKKIEEKPSEPDEAEEAEEAVPKEG
jgi:ATP-dependent Clp protease ATP-binding subunit ClpC